MNPFKNKKAKTENMKDMRMYFKLTSYASVSSNFFLVNHRFRSNTIQKFMRFWNFL